MVHLSEFLADIFRLDRSSFEFFDESVYSSKLFFPQFPTSKGKATVGTVECSSKSLDRTFIGGGVSAGWEFRGYLAKFTKTCNARNRDCLVI